MLHFQNLHFKIHPLRSDNTCSAYSPQRNGLYWRWKHLATYISPRISGLMLGRNCSCGFHQTLNLICQFTSISFMYLYHNTNISRHLGLYSLGRFYTVKSKKNHTKIFVKVRFKLKFKIANDWFVEVETVFLTTCYIHRYTVQYSHKLLSTKCRGLSCWISGLLQWYEKLVYLSIVEWKEFNIFHIHWVF